MLSHMVSLPQRRQGIAKKCGSYVTITRFSSFHDFFGRSVKKKAKSFDSDKARSKPDLDRIERMKRVNNTR